MQFQHEPDEYINNLMEYRALDETQFLPSESKEEVIRKLKEISRRKKEIAEKQNEIVAEYAETFENGTEKLDDESSQRLGKFVENLFLDHQFPVDPAIALRLCRLLYSYYHETGDRDKTIHVICLGTKSEMILSYYQSDSDFFEFPQLCEEFFPAFEELSKEFQNELVYAYSYRINVRTDKGYQELPELYVRVEERMRACVDGAIDKSLIESLLFTMTANFANYYCDMCRRNEIEIRKGNPPLFETKQATFLEQFVKNIRRMESEFKETTGDPRYVISMMILCYQTYFHLGILSFDELLQKFDELKIYGENQGLGNAADLATASAYLGYLYYCSPYKREENERLSRERVNELIPKILEMKRSRDHSLSWNIVAFLANSSFLVNFSEFYDTALAFTVYVDKALYVHTVMVRKICHLLLSRLMEEKPEFLNGTCGKSAREILESKEEMLDLMDQCAMCHDIGKHFMIDVVSNSSRRLTEDEFLIIKSHPKNFEIVCDQNMSETPKQKCIRDCALLHHRWHNGEGGYPSIVHTENRPFVDIIAIADSLDAATDSIGRPYGVGKSLEELIAEFNEMSGTRYAREVTEVLSEPDVREAVREIITAQREEVNYQIYAFNHYKL